MRNKEIALILEKIASLLELEDGNPFRIRALRRSAQVIETLNFDAESAMREEPSRLAGVPGIGEGSLKRIGEILATSTCSELEQLGQRMPLSLLDLLKVPSLGPRRVKQLWSELGICSLQDLQQAAVEGRLKKLPGLGPASEKKIERSLQLLLASEGRHRLDAARVVAADLLEYLKHVVKPELASEAGSVRRWKETVRDIDILIAGATAESTFTALEDYPGTVHRVAAGPTKASVRLEGNLACDVRVVEADSFGAALQYFTGSKEHNVVLRERAKRQGYKISEYGVFLGDVRVAGRSEEEVYSTLGFPCIPPEIRENRGELEITDPNGLPRLIGINDIRGELHLHTTASDGKDQLGEMVSAARDLGYEYMAVTDHSSTLAIVGGLNEEALQSQGGEVDRLNAAEPGLRILKGIEVDILADGKLSLGDEALSRLDLVIASVHSRFDLSRKEMTRRVCRALENPHVNILAHPTGRILLKRQAYDLDLEQVIDTARENRVCLEINGHPKRLDLSDVSARIAYDRGALLAVNSDAHSRDALGMMQYGVATARRAWLTPESVINAFPLERLLRVLAKEDYRN